MSDTTIAPSSDVWIYRWIIPIEISRTNIWDLFEERGTILEPENNEESIVNEYREGKVKRTLKEWKDFETSSR